MTEIEAFEAMYGITYLRTKKPHEYAIVLEAWHAACAWQREADRELYALALAEALNAKSANSF